MSLRAASLAVALVAVPGGTAMAESGRFAVSFGGLGAGTLSYDATVAGDAYAMQGRARQGGVLGLVFSARVDSSAEGKVVDNRYAPRLAREVVREGGETETRTLSYKGGIPSVTDDPPDRPSRHAAPPGEQKGTVDSTTAAFAILRDRPEALACRLDLSLYDGRRRHRIRLDQAQPSADGLTCRGVYSRVAGFSPEDMQGQRDWPLTLDYVRLADGTLRVSTLTFPTSFGTARIERQD